MTTETKPSRFVTIREFMNRSTLCRASVYNLIARGDLARPNNITQKKVGWSSEYVDGWFAERMVQQGAA